jgi:hypothetical protein
MSDEDGTQPAIEPLLVRSIQIKLVRAVTGTPLRLKVRDFPA